MRHEDEVANGIAFIENEVKSHGYTLDSKRVGIREYYYFEIKGAQASTDFTLSEEFLSDIPGTRDHRTHLKSALSNIFIRMRNGSPNDFYAISGSPFNLRIRWPINSHPSRDVVWVRADVKDLRYPSLVAKIAAVIFGGVEDAEFQFRPLDRIGAVVNAVRSSLDNSQLEFFEPDTHPQELQEVDITDLSSGTRLNDESIEQFVSAKVFWLAFKCSDVPTPVWIADPLDASYLGVGVREMIQAARVAQARHLIKLSSDNQFATAEDALILSQRQSEAIPVRGRIGFVQ